MARSDLEAGFLGWIFGAVGSGLSANQSIRQGEQSQDAADDEARQRRQQAKGEVAAASFNTERIRKKAEEYLKTQRSRAAVGGQSSTDATSVAIQAETVKNASIDQLLVMAEAEERARQMNIDAHQMEQSGQIDASSGQVRGFAHAMQGVSTIIGAFGDSWSNSYGGGNARVATSRGSR